MATRTTTKKAELKTSTAKPTTEKEAPAKKTTTVKAAVKGSGRKKWAKKKLILQILRFILNQKTMVHIT